MLHFRSPAVERDSGLGHEAGLEGHGMSPLTTFSMTGLAPSALIDTMKGRVPARDLKPGDLLITRDHGATPVRWVGESMMVYETEGELAPGERGPVRIRAGALGTDPEAGNLVVNAGHKILLRSPMNELYFGTGEVLAEAGDLTHLDGVDVVTRAVMRFRHILLDTHELISANGVWMESFAPEMWAIRVAFPDEWAEITECVPRLRYEGGEANYIAPRMVLNGREAQVVRAAA